MAQKKCFRLDDDVIESVKKLAEEQNTTETAIINAAVKYYRDYLYMQKSQVIPDEVQRTLSAQVALLEHRLNNRSNKLLSELAIQQCIICRVLTENLEISPLAIDGYRRQAIEYLESNQRVFRLEEGIE